MIVKQRRLDVAEAKTRVAAEALRARVAAAAPPNDFAAVLSKSGPMALLAEMKRASPSKGDIAPHTDAAQQGLTYALAGACTISVLTEPSWFKGSLDDLARVRAALVAGGLGEEVCVLRKDFIVDEYQLLEARAHGADTALLIVAALSAAELSSLMAFSRSLGMEPLVEAANEGEMRVALDAGARVIGVNNRNLHTFEVDMTTTSRCAALVPSGEKSRAAGGRESEREVRRPPSRAGRPPAPQARACASLPSPALRLAPTSPPSLTSARAASSLASL